MFIYFVPAGIAGVPADLSYAFEASPATRDVLRDGPNGGKGRLLCADANHLARYKAGSHTWRQIPGSKCWLGYDPDHLPSPESLARKTQIAGHKVTIDWTDIEWVVPLARTLVESSDGMRFTTTLPTQYDLTETGQWVYAGVRPRFKRLYEIASEWYDAQMSGGKAEDGHVVIEVDPQRCADQACEVLGYNYRVGRLELVVLGVAGTDFWQTILNATIDMAGILELIQRRLDAADDPEKKTEDGQAFETLNAIAGSAA